MTFNSKPIHGRAGPADTHTKGGYSKHMVVQEHFVIKVPKEYPLECAGKAPSMTVISLHHRSCRSRVPLSDMCLSNTTILVSMQHTGPIMCAAITMWDPLRHWGAKPGMRVGFVGIGGLGHIGIKLAKALGCGAPRNARQCRLL